MKKEKPLKLTGDLEYLGIVVPTMLEYIKKGTGTHIKKEMTNHSTVVITLSNGVELMCWAYETKTLIVISWNKTDA